MKYPEVSGLTQMSKDLVTYCFGDDILTNAEGLPYAEFKHRIRDQIDFVMEAAAEVSDKREEIAKYLYKCYLYYQLEDAPDNVVIWQRAQADFEAAHPWKARCIRAHQALTTGVLCALYYGGYPIVLAVRAYSNLGRRMMTAQNDYLLARLKEIRGEVEEELREVPDPE